MYVAVNWCGHTEPIKEERIPKKWLKNVDWGAGCFGNWGEKRGWGRRKRKTLDDTI